jgi:hydroxymethylglutaryl-CoA lyase
MADQARIFEVGPRDGLQNEAAILDVETRVALIERLVDAGARDIEMGSFVHPKWLPQMANTDEVARQMTRRDGVRYWALVPNMRGLERARQAEISHIAVFVSASETHNRKNLNRSVAESMAEIKEVMAEAVAAGMEARAYVSMVFGCPYEGKIAFDRVLEISDELVGMGVGMISLGDTIGIGTPLQVRQGCQRALERFGADRLALHLHDTRGMGVTNAMVAWEAGMRSFDSSVGGIGGCPYAPGAAGNLGSEDLIYLLDSMGIETGISLEALGQTSQWLEDVAQIKVPSRCTNYLQSARHDL